jgi:hypothetical protein
LGILDFAVGYGSFAGFTDLTGAATAAHIHGPAGVDGVNSPVYNFFTELQHLPAPNPLQGGVIIGSLVLTNGTDVTNLMSGLFYINIHTATNPGGEVRGQLIPMLNVAPTLICPDPVRVECSSARGTLVRMVAGVQDANGDLLTVTWTIDGRVYQTDEVPSGGDSTAARVVLDGLFGYGDHVVVVSVTDGKSEPVQCRTRVQVIDTVAPEVGEVVARPNVLWPPNHKMVPVRLRVRTQDDCGPVTSRIIGVRSNEPINGTGDGDTGADWRIADDLTVLLRAERSGPGSGRIYTIHVESTDVGGNTTLSRVQVVVPHDQGKGKGKGYYDRDDDDDGDDDDDDDDDRGQGKSKKVKKSNSNGRGNSGK